MSVYLRLFSLCTPSSCLFLPVQLSWHSGCLAVFVLRAAFCYVLSYICNTPGKSERVKEREREKERDTKKKTEVRALRDRETNGKERCRIRQLTACGGEDEIKRKRTNIWVGQQNDIEKEWAGDRERKMEWTGVKAINLQAWSCCCCCLCVRVCGW